VGGQRELEPQAGAGVPVRRVIRAAWASVRNVGSGGSGQVCGEPGAQGDESGRAGGCAELGQTQRGNATVAVQCRHRDGGRAQGHCSIEDIRLRVRLETGVSQGY
jgi:hypothetical protein